MWKKCTGIIYLSVLMACANQAELSSRPQSQELGVRQFKKNGDVEPAFYYCEHDPLDAWGCATVTPKTPYTAQQELAFTSPDRQLANVSTATSKSWTESEAVTASRAETTEERVKERVRRLQSGDETSEGQAASGSVRKEKKEVNPAGSSELLATIYFDFDRHELTSEAKFILDPVRTDTALTQNRLLVLGYTDSIGGRQYNDELARKRARTVVDYLLSGSIIKPSDVTARGYGLCCYVRENDKDSNRKYNRRVEVRIQPRNQGST